MTASVCLLPSELSARLGSLYLPAACPKKDAEPAFLPPFLPRGGWVPALLGQPGGPLRRGHWRRIRDAAIEEKPWLPITGQLNRSLSLSPLTFGIFVTPQTAMAAVHPHTGCALHDSRRCPSQEQGVSGAPSLVQAGALGALGLERASKHRTLLSLCSSLQSFPFTFRNFSLPTYPCSTETSFFALYWFIFSLHK